MSTPADDIRLPARDPSGHKGTFGTVAVIGGCAHGSGDARDDDDGVRMIGGPALAALAAMRTGAGLVRLVLPEPILNAGLVIAPGATGVALPVSADWRIVAHEAARTLDRVLGAIRALLIGPGLGAGDAERALSLRAVQQEDAPVVVDADALNNLAQVPALWQDFRAQAILTPHPGEYARLGGSLGIDIDCKRDPDRACAELARRLGCVVVLKGARTVVSDGQREWAHDDANPVLATGGTGDVLAGIIAGLVAQHHRAPMFIRGDGGGGGSGLGLFEAARAGVAIHARAARAWSERHHARGGMLATDLLEEIPRIVEAMRAPDAG